MSVEVLGRALWAPVGGNAKVVLLGLANHADLDGANARPAVATLAAYAYCAERTVQRQLRELERDGWIAQTGWHANGGHGGRQTAVYRLTAAALQGRQIDTAAEGRGDTGAPRGVTPVSPKPSLEPDQGSPTLDHGSEEAPEAERGTSETAAIGANAVQPAARAGAREAAQRLPDGFPTELVPHARAVFSVLREVAEQHNARVVTPRAVGLAIQGNPGRRFVAEAYSLASWAAEPPRPIRDVVATYRRWLSTSDRHAGVEPLDGMGAPVGAPARNGAGRSRGPSARDFYELGQRYGREDGDDDDAA